MKINNKWLQTINTIMDFLLLNILWVILCIPVVTFFPATAALFGVMRKKVLQKECDGIFKAFFSLFKENFKQSFLISIPWTLFGVFLYMDYMYIDSKLFWLQIVLKIALFIGVLLFLAASVYLFPVMVHFELDWKNVIRNAVFLALMNPVLTILLLIILGATLFCVYSFPAAILGISSISVYVIYHLCQIAFNQLQQLSQGKES